MNVNCFEKLPEELILKCFAYLSRQELYTIRQADHTSNRIAMEYISELQEVHTQIAWLKATHVKSHVESLYSCIWLKAGEFLDKHSKDYYKITLISIPIILGFYIARPFVQIAQAMENTTKLIFFKLTEINAEIKAEKIQICKRRLIKELSFLSIGIYENFFLMPIYFFRTVFGLFSKDMRSKDACHEYPPYWFCNRLFDLSLLAQDPFQFFSFSEPTHNMENQKDVVVKYFMHFFYNVSQDPLLNKAYNIYLKYSECGYKWENKLSSCFHPGIWKLYFFHNNVDKNWNPIENKHNKTRGYPSKAQKIETIKMTIWMNNDTPCVWDLPEKEKNLVSYILKFSDPNL